MQVYDSAVKQTPVISQLRGVWERRGLLRLLVSRDLTVRYKRSVVGIWWSLLNPLFTTAVMFWVFNTAFKNRMPEQSQFLTYVLSGVLVMTLFNQALTMGAESLAAGSGILTKVHAQPELFAISPTISASINFIFGLIPLTFVVLLTGAKFNLLLPLVLVVVICMILFTTGLSLLLALAFISFHDTKPIFQIILLGLQYMSPVFYPISVLGPHTRKVIELNPLTSFLAIFRDLFSHSDSASAFSWFMMMGSSFSIFILGLFVFQKKWPSVVAKI